MVSDLTYSTGEQGVLSIWPVYNKNTKKHFLDLKGHFSCTSYVVHTIYEKALKVLQKEKLDYLSSLSKLS